MNKKNEKAKVKVKRSWGSTISYENRICKSCDYNKEKGYKMLFSYEVWLVINKLCSEIEKEWQAMLIGTVNDEDRVVTITDYWIPKQKASDATVINNDMITKELIEEKNIVATIHSHSNMNVYFSQTDIVDTNFNPFIRHHIVVNNRMEFVCCTRMDLPCGMARFPEGEVIYEDNTPDVEVKGIENITIEESKRNGLYLGWSSNKYSKGRYGYGYGGYGYGYGGYGYGYGHNKHNKIITGHDQLEEAEEEFFNKDEDDWRKYHAILDKDDTRKDIDLCQE